MNNFMNKFEQNSGDSSSETTSNNHTNSFEEDESAFKSDEEASGVNIKQIMKKMKKREAQTPKHHTVSK